MNHVPRHYSTFGGGAGNYIPGHMRFPRGGPTEEDRYNFELINDGYLKWAQRLGAGDHAGAAQQANDLLKIVAQVASQPVLTDLLAAMQLAVNAVQPKPTSASDATGAEDVDNIDWYEPDPNFFYVLDQRSGAELRAVLDDLRCMSRYIKRGARAPNRLLFIGEPGNGKTVGARWLGSALGMPVALVRIDATVVSSVGGIADRLRKAFEAAWERKGVLVIDEFEAVAVPRSNTSANVGQWSRETTSALLQLLDSLPAEQIVVGATNILEGVDAAVRRRMRKHVYFYPPDRDARAAMIDTWWKTAPHDSKAKRRILDCTEGYSGDVLERIAEEANRAAARRAEEAPVTIHDVDVAVLSVIGDAPTPQESVAEGSP